CGSPLYLLEVDVSLSEFVCALPGEDDHTVCLLTDELRHQVHACTYTHTHTHTHTHTYTHEAHVFKRSRSEMATAGSEIWPVNKEIGNKAGNTVKWGSNHIETQNNILCCHGTSCSS